MAPRNAQSVACARIGAVKLRLPFDAPLPDRPASRAGVLAMLVVGGLVALLVVVVFGIVLVDMLSTG